MKVIAILFLLLGFISNSIAQKRNIEIGMQIFSIITQNSGLHNAENNYSSSLSNPLQNDRKYFNRYFDRKEIIQKTFTTPTVFFRKKVYKLFYLKSGLSYVNTTVSAIDTFDEQMGTGRNTYFSYNHQQRGLLFSIAPQIQWLHQKRIYAHSGIEASFYYLRSKLLSDGLGYGCISVQSSRFNLLYNYSRLGLQKIYLTSSFGYMFIKNLNIGYEFQTDFQFFVNKPILVHQFWLSKCF